MFRLSPQRSRRRGLLWLIIVLCVVVCQSTAIAAPLDLSPYWQAAQAQIEDFQLRNGLRFIVMRRPQAPVVSVLTYAAVGGADEQPGQTGIAHFLEHLAFKGTTTIGTRNYAEEAPLLAELDQLNRQLQQAQGAEITALTQRFQAVQAQAARYVQQNEFGQRLENAGAVGLNATTSADATTYFCSLPAQQLELWMALEAERFRQPVFREFFEEKAVILEERRQRLDNDPVSQLLEALKAKAFPNQPYGRPVIGERADIEALDRATVQRFFEQYYGPNNLTIAIVGDVDPTQVRRWANQYFAAEPSRPTPVRPKAIAKPQAGTVTLTARSQPWAVVAYPMPAARDPDQLAMQLLAEVLSRGRRSRLYQNLVEGDRLVVAAQAFPNFPGDRLPSLFVISASPRPGVEPQTVVQAITAMVEQLRQQPLTQAELDRVRNQLRMDLLEGLESNAGMAQQLAEYQAEAGDWRQLFRDLEVLEQLTPEDLQRAARRLFQRDRQLVGQLLGAAS
ncbi:M16 family metallopeptidase [Synechococcus elongatus]|uniref:Pitrilysin family protein n=1 Tax=Synechococcus elongatus PCC 11802 TaxID=2283154 RepID=A0AAT9K3U1_SYNEL|nr:pitrilysin family protein [Synechococcus elongatus]